VAFEDLSTYVIDRTERDTGRRMKIGDRRLREALSWMDDVVEGYRLKIDGDGS